MVMKHVSAFGHSVLVRWTYDIGTNWARQKHFVQGIWVFEIVRTVILNDTRAPKLKLCIVNTHITVNDKIVRNACR